MPFMVVIDFTCGKKYSSNSTFNVLVWYLPARKVWLK